jgi:hypothetical protein
MIDRARGTVPLTATRVGPTDLGAATAAIDDESLTIVAPTAGDEASLRVRLSSIDGVSAAAGQLSIA